MCWDLSLHINFCINTLVFYSVGYVTQTRTASGFNHKQARANEKGFFSTNLICWCIYIGTCRETQAFHTCSYSAQTIQKLHDYSWCSNEPNLRALLRGRICLFRLKKLWFSITSSCWLSSLVSAQAEVYGNFLQEASLSTKGTSELKNRSLKSNREGFVFMCKDWYFLPE